MRGLPSVAMAGSPEARRPSPSAASPVATPAARNPRRLRLRSGACPAPVVIALLLIPHLHGGFGPCGFACLTGLFLAADQRAMGPDSAHTRGKHAPEPGYTRPLPGDAATARMSAP